MSPCPARARTTAKYAKPRSNRPIGSGLGGLLPRLWRVEKLGEEELDAQTAAGIVADCVRDGHHQAIHILDLPLPEPPPKGAEWIAAYRHWARFA